EKGLMFKLWSTPIMSFPYTYPAIRKFWMKNKISPLVIIFCLNGKIIDIVQGQPEDETYLGPNKKCDLVVEMPARTYLKNNINIGDNIKLKLSKLTLFKIKKYKDYLP